MGALANYASQVAYDAISQGDRAYSNAIAEEGKYEWYLYSGTDQENSRPFCEERKGKYFHFKEIEAWADLNWQGKADGTNAQTIFILAGGYRCIDSILPVSIAVVPEEVIQRNIQNGNYNPDIVSEVPPPELTVQNIMEAAKEAKSELEQATKNILTETDAIATPVDLKTERSIMRKVTEEYGGDVSQVGDAVRNTIIGEKEEISSILKAVKEEFGNAIIKYKHQSPENYMGYSGDLFNIRFSNGSIGEMQVNTAKMIYAKESEAAAKHILGDDLWNAIRRETGQPGGLGHKYYEEYRLISTSAKRKMELKRLSEEYYSHFTD